MQSSSTVSEKVVLEINAVSWPFSGLQSVTHIIKIGGTAMIRLVSESRSCFSKNFHM